MKISLRLITGLILFGIYVVQDRTIVSLRKANTVANDAYTATAFQLMKTRQERDQFAKAFLDALAAQAVCEAQFQAMFEKRVYAGK